jgi:hypothetical protein
MKTKTLKMDTMNIVYTDSTVPRLIDTCELTVKVSCVEPCLGGPGGGSCADLSVNFLGSRTNKCW